MHGERLNGGSVLVTKTHSMRPVKWGSALTREDHYGVEVYIYGSCMVWELGYGQVHCKKSMVVLTHIRSTQFHGTTECTVKCISVRSLYSGKPSYIVFLWWG